MSRQSDQVKTFFHGYAENFDAIYGHTGKRNFIGRWIDKHLRRTMRLRFEETLKQTSNPEIQSILDVGCGPGRYGVEFLKQGKKVVELDMAEGMLEIARQVIGDIRHEGSVEFIQADYLIHPFKEKFDAACLMGFFDYIENPVEVIEKLKKDVTGEIYASFPKNAGLLAKTRTVRYRLRQCPLFLYTIEDIRKIMEKTGLSDRYGITDCERDYFIKITLG